MYTTVETPIHSRKQQNHGLANHGMLFTAGMLAATSIACRWEIQTIVHMLDTRGRGTCSVVIPDFGDQPSHADNLALLLYSLFKPTFPTLLSPSPPIATATNIHPKQTQNVTRYPFISASGDVFSVKSLLSVTDPDIDAMMARPREVPNWANVWKQHRRVLVCGEERRQ